MGKKLLSMLLAIAMLVSMVPAAYAEDEITVVEAPAEAQDELAVVEEPAEAEEAAPEAKPAPAAEPMGNSHEDATPLTLDVEATAEITEPGGYAYFSFTPEETMDIEFTSYADLDTYGYLYDSDWNQLAYNDDGGSANNFLIQWELTGGETYYFGARYYSSEYTGSFPVKLTTYFNNHFTAEAVQGTVTAKPGESATMEVIADSRDPEKITYQWYDISNDPIEGETGSTYTIENVVGHLNLYCIVEDGYGGRISVEFALRVDSGFSAVPEQREVYVSPNQTATLRVITTSDTPELLTFQWRDENWNSIEGATGDSYTTGPITGDTMYVCDVEDGYGLGESVRFYVYIDTHFRAEAVQSDFNVSFNETATLEVNASSDLQDAITYQWYGREYYNDGNDWNYVAIEGSTGSSLTTDPVTRYTEYYCTVSDGYNRIDVWFYVYVETHFRAEAVQSNFYVPLNETATLEVVATSDLQDAITYRWYDNDLNQIEGETGSSYVTGPVTGNRQYHCEVSDGYNSTNVWFNVHVETHFSARAVQNSIRAQINETATLEVEAGSDLPLSYRWYKCYKYVYGSGSSDWYWEIDWEHPIEGETGSSLVTDPVTEQMRYVCEVSDEYNSTTVEFTVSIETNFSVSQVQQTFTVAAGETATLEVIASSDDPDKISYQWIKGYRYYSSSGDSWWTWDWDGRIEGATGSSLTTDPATEAMYYACRVEDGYGQSRTLDFYVYIDTHFRAESVQYRVYAPLNESATLEVRASSDDPEKITYQWFGPEYYNDGNDWRYVAIEGETGSSYTTGPVTRGSEYYCRVGDGYGRYQNVWFYVGVDTHFSAYAKTWNLRTPVGETATMEVEASSDLPLTFKWYKGYKYYNDNGEWWWDFDRDHPIEGATGSSLISDPVTDQMYYWCEVFDEYNSETVSFNITVDTHFTARAVQSDVKVQSGTAATLEVNASSDDPDAITYQWYQAFKYYRPDGGWYWTYDEEDIVPGVTGSSLTTPPVTEAIGYVCLVSDGYGSTEHIWFTVSIETHFSVRILQDSYTVAPGETATLEVIATSDYPEKITYQWYTREFYENSTSNWYWAAVEGATESSFTTPPVEKTAMYCCEVSDGYGSIQSRQFTVSPDYTSVMADLALPLVLDTDIDAVVTGDCEFAFYYYIPEETGVYIIASYSNDDTYVHLYDAEGRQLATNDDGGGNGNFYLSYRLTEGEKYYYGVRYYNRANVGTIPIRFWRSNELEVTPGYLNLTVEPGATPTLSVSAKAIDASHISYQWQEYKEIADEDGNNWQWVDIEGATGSSYTTPAVNASAEYRCLVEDGYDGRATATFNISIETHFTARAAKSEVFVELYDTATLEVIASSDYPEKLSYTWYCRGDLLKDETGATLVTGPVTGYIYYSCEVSDGFGNTRHLGFPVYVDSGFSVKARQTEFYIQPGESVDLELIVTSDYPDKLSYEWHECTMSRYGLNDWYWEWSETLEGADGPILTVGPIEERAHYVGTVWDGFGRAWGIEFDIYIDTGFSAEAVQDTLYVPYEQSATLEVAASVKAPGELSYQWYSTSIESWMGNTYWYDEAPISGAAGASFTVPSVTGHEIYLCQVTDGFGREAVIEFNVYVRTNFSARAEQETILVRSGDPATLRVIASVDDPGELYYSWYEYFTYIEYDHEYHDFRWIENEEASLTLDKVTDYSNIYCLVWDGCGDVKRVDFYVSVENHFAAEAVNPVNYIGEDDAVELKLKLSGDDLTGVTYQWYSYRESAMGRAGYFSYLPINGETGSTLFATTYPELYRCVVKDRYGTPITVDFEVHKGEAPEGYSVTVDLQYVTNSKGKVLAGTDLDPDALYSGEVEFTVTSESDQAVLVAVKNGDEYTPLACSTDEYGVHSFTVMVEEDTVIVLAVKGDVNLDGDVKLKDNLMVKKHIAKSELITNPLALLTANVDGSDDGKIRLKDNLMIKKHIAKSELIPW